MKEEMLLKKAKNGNKDSFGELIKLYENKIYAICFKVFKNEQDALDATQEVCIKIYEKLDKYNYESKFGTWVYRVAMNTAIDEYRKNQRKIKKETSMDEMLQVDDGSMNKQFSSDKDSTLEQVINNENKRIVWEGLNELDLIQKNIIIMKDIEGYTYKDIAKTYNIGIGTVKSRLSRARKALKEMIVNNRNKNINETSKKKGGIL